MHDPREPHLTTMKRTLRYLWGTLDYGLLLRRPASSELTVYTDVDWTSYPDTPIHLRLRCVLRRQPHLMIFEASEHRLPIECRGRVLDRGQWCGGGLLAAVATSGAPHSADEEHPHLL
jgi:hypothetical protein